MLQPELLGRILSFLDNNHIDYMVTGSIVSSLQGEPRVTHDIDMVINISSEAIPVLAKSFQSPQYYLSENSAKEAIINQSMFNLLDTTNGDKIDFWILTNEPFDKSRFKRKYEEGVFGLKMKVSRPEDTILAKLKWSKISGGSEKQFIDALRVYEIQLGNLDLSYLEGWAKRLNVTALWEKLKSDAKPIE